MKVRINELEKELNAQELLELDEAEKKPIRFSEDSPEMTPEMLKEFKRMSKRNNSAKQTVSLRLSEETMEIAKAYGKGYTAFLSRLLNEAIKDKDLVKKCI